MHASSRSFPCRTWFCPVERNKPVSTPIEIQTTKSRLCGSTNRAGRAVKYDLDKAKKQKWSERADWKDCLATKWRIRTSEGFCCTNWSSNSPSLILNRAKVFQVKLRMLVEEIENKEDVRGSALQRGLAQRPGRGSLLSTLASSQHPLLFAFTTVEDGPESVPTLPWLISASRALNKGSTSFIGPFCLYCY